MKKILALVLATLMLMSLAITASAGNIVTTNPNKTPTADDFKGLLQYWQYVNSEKDYPWYGGDAHSMYDYCEKCGIPAYYYLYGGKVYCSCTTCGTYLTKVSGGNSSNVNDDLDSGFTISPEEEFNSKFGHFYSTCDDSKHIQIRHTGYTYYWRCTNCGNNGTIATDYWGTDGIDNWHGNWCWDHNCNWLWGCDHSWNWNWNWTWGDKWPNYYWDYGITVYCYKGGNYSIDSYTYANYGDVRTITFTPDYGYVLSEVTVNGVSYGYSPTLTLTITGNTVVRAYFVPVSSLRPCTFTATAVGSGSVTAVKNSKAINSSKLTAMYTDTVTYKFIPAGKNYYIKNVTIDGKSMGDITTYTFSGGSISKDHNIVATFAWQSPYNDLSDTYAEAVEYVTEAGIMGYYNKYVNKNAFCGNAEITVANIAAALAEMADTSEMLSDNASRVKWATDNGIIAADADTTAVCTVQTACDIVNAYLIILERNARVNFTGFYPNDTAKENAISIGLVSSSTYKNNRNLTRYDLASICYLLANLEY